MTAKRPARIHRRTLLRTVGATSLLAGLAGCAEVNVTVDGDTGVGGIGGDDDTPTADDGDATGDDGDATATAASSDGSDGGTGAPDATTTAGVGDCALATPDADTTSTEFSGTVSTDTTLGADADEVRITDDVNVRDGATLTVAPATRLTFSSRAGLVVEEGGAVDAVGTCAEPILFTGAQATRGFWQGVQVRGSAGPSRLAHVVIEYGGSHRPSHASRAANLVVGASGFSLTNSTLRGSGAFGLALEHRATVDDFARNRLTENAGGAAWGTPESVGGLAAESTYVGNDEDAVVVNDETLDADRTWPALDVPYRIEDDADVDVAGHLTVAPGATVEFGQGSSLIVEDGALTAVGMDPDTEASKPITFTGVQKTRGYWRGIHFYNSNRTENRLQRVVVEYAGGGRAFSHASTVANVVASGTARVRIAYTTIRESAAYGLGLGPRAKGDAFVGNTLTRNADGAVRVASETTHLLSDLSEYAGNDEDAVVVVDGRIAEDVTWDALDVPYRIEDDAGVDVAGHLTVAPGATVEFGQRASLIVEDGALTAVGIDPDTEASTPITFTGVQKTEGYWRGIHFYNSNRAENQLRQAVVEYGGGEPQFSHASGRGNVVVSGGSRVMIRSCLIRDSAGYGVVAGSKATLATYGVDYVRNADGPEP